MKKTTISIFIAIIVVNILAIIFSLASCSPSSRAVHFKKVHPNGMWTMKGYIPPIKDTIKTKQ